MQSGFKETRDEVEQRRRCLMQMLIKTNLQPELLHKVLYYAVLRAESVREKFWGKRRQVHN